MFTYEKKPSQVIGHGQMGQGMIPNIFQNLSQVNKSKSKEKGHFYMK